MKILLVTRPMPAAPFEAAIRALAAQHEFIEYSRALEQVVLDDVDVVLGWQMPPGIAGRLPRLRWVCAVAAGVEKLLAEDLPGHVPVSRIVDAEQAHGIAQFVVLMALRHARALPMYEAQQRERNWRRQPVAAVRSRVAVLGTGAMGSVVLSLLAAVGFDARGWSRRSAEPLEAVLAASDIVVCALPLTPLTEGLLDARAFAAMPRGSYLVNIARGGHVVEPDLIAAVRSGHLAGAALDVFNTEPLPADHRYWTHPKVQVTPHIAGTTNPRTASPGIIENIKRLRSGQALINAVNPKTGY